MNLPFHIARRYLLAKKSTNAVNWITGISSLGVMVGTAAMVVVLAAFAGLDDLVRSFYTSFDPDIKLVPKEGKFMEWTDGEMEILEELDFVDQWSQVVEEKALFRFREREYIAVVKGVDDSYSYVSSIDSFVVNGQFIDPSSAEAGGVFGVGVADYIGLRTMSVLDPVMVYVPKNGAVDKMDPMGNVRFKYINPKGFFQIQPEFDTKYVFTSLEFAQGLFGQEESFVSAIEIKLQEGISMREAKEELTSRYGDLWEVKDRDDLQVAIFKVLKSEGLITFLVLTFILLVASFGILSSVNILILEKKNDIFTLWSMGASERLLRRIFLVEGLLISLGGAGIGFVIGVIIVLLQKHVGLLSMGSGYVVEYYPVALRPADILQVLVTIVMVGTTISWFAVRRLRVSKLK